MPRKLRKTSELVYVHVTLSAPIILREKANNDFHVRYFHAIKLRKRDGERQNSWMAHPL